MNLTKDKKVHHFPLKDHFALTDLLCQKETLDES